MTISTTALYRSIHAQPEAVRQLLQDWSGPERAAELLVSKKRILLTGIGTSFHAANVGEYLLRRAGSEAWAQRAFEFVSYPRPLSANDSVIVISHRGSKHYSGQAIQRATQVGVATIGITGKQTKMQGADLTLETVEQDPSSTHSISYVGALTRLAQIATRLAALQGHDQTARQLEEGLNQVPTLMEEILRRENEVQRVAQEAGEQRRRVYFIGAGPNAMGASEGALKAKEAAYITTEGFELEQALHGPQVAFETNDLLVPINVSGAAQERTGALLRVLHEIGTQTWLLGSLPEETSATLFERPGWSRFALSDEATLPEELTPLLVALPLQLLANFLAETRGTNADSFRADQEVYKRAGQQFAL